MTVVHVDRAAVATPSPARVRGGLRRWTTRLEERRCVRADQERAAHLVRAFYGTVRHVGLTDDTFSAAGVHGVAWPVVTSVVLGPVTRVNVRPMHGQLLSDFEQVAPRLARAFGVVRVRMTEARNGLIRMDLMHVDPLSASVPLPAPVSSVFDPITLGLAESGELVRVPLADLAHIILQGATRSGKSRMVYGLLSQLAGCRDLVIAGSDVTGVLLRPFLNTRHGDWIASGGVDLERHVEAVEGLVGLMHERHEKIPARLDVLPITEDDSLILVVIEEYGVLVDLLGTHDTQHKTKLQARFRAAVRSLLAGGAKVGFRVLIITQRAEAAGPAGIGSFERGQAPLRLTFRVDTHESVKLLHPAAPKEVAEQHANSPAGVALLSAPQIPLAYLRAPTVGDYGTYADAVAGASST